MLYFTHWVMETKKYLTIDLFAGIGGIRLGFEKNGFETVFANDFDPYCKATYDWTVLSTRFLTCAATV